MKKIRTAAIITIIALATAWTIFFVHTGHFNNKLLAFYEGRQSVESRDNNNRIIRIYQNPYGNYAVRATDFPEEMKKSIIQKEDKYFYYHTGVNPVSTARAIMNYATKKNKPTASTITQQLVKLLLGQETNRNLKNKIKEIYYTIALELHSDKDDILGMYLNTLFLGNQTEGLKSAAWLYFDKEPEALSREAQLQLLASVNNPSNANPFFAANIESAKLLANKLGLNINDTLLKTSAKNKALAAFDKRVRDTAAFEIDSLDLAARGNLSLTIDQELSQKTRSIISENIEKLYKDNALNAAAVIIATDKEKNHNELLAIIGSPNPEEEVYGYKINMAIRSRAIGSTVKPFIYTEGFRTGLRPYTLVEDREYKYMIGTGYAFYPKNYDYEYRGTVNLHYALSNSLNVPSVKVLEYVGLEKFYRLLTDDLEFDPVQDLSNYQLGIALGELEMDLLTLARYFTVFPNNGVLRPLLVSEGLCLGNDAGKCPEPNEIFQSPYVALTNKILSDRHTGAEEFGLKSNLDLPFENYAVKTGTSREYHDSWAVGYTPDFTVGVWVGNAEDRPMDKVSGVAGAGKIWQDIMNLLFNSKYNKNSEFDFSSLKDYPDGDGLNIGLAGDDYEAQKNLLGDQTLILSPHNFDEFLFETGMSIPLKASAEVKWKINGELLGNSREYFLKITSPGKYEIKAENGEQSQTITVYVNKD